MMGASGGFPIDLILFGMIAAFLVLRLRSILGKRTGFERPPEAMPRRIRPSNSGSSATVCRRLPSSASTSAVRGKKLHGTT